MTPLARFVVVGATLLLASCRQIVGIDDRGLADAADARTCSVPDVGGACEACLAGSCCDELAACNSDLSCKRSFDCIAKCAPGDELCSVACSVAFDAKLAGALACRARSCAEPCALSCGGILGPMQPTRVTDRTCADCLTKAACVEAAACARDAKCIQAACPWYCPLEDRACKSQCLVPLGLQPAADALYRAEGVCATECGWGTNWTCVGKSKYLPGKAGGDVPFALRTMSGLDAKTFVAGATIRPCLNAACDIPNGVACTSDADGLCLGKLKLTAGLVFNGYFEITAKDAWTVLTQWHPPITGEIAGSLSSFIYTVPVVTETGVRAAAAYLRADLLPGRAHISAVVYDCAWSGAKDLVVEVSNADGDTQVRYSTSTPLDTKATVDGAAYLFNVPATAAPVTVRAKLKDVVKAELDVFVRPDAFSWVLIGPK